MKEDEVYSHPSYGQITFSRVNGTNRFYGSELKQDNYITMELSLSEQHTGLSRVSHFVRKTIVKLRMSSMQFSEMITSMNMGGGVPCTLEFYDGEKTLPLPEIENRKEFVHRKFDDRMRQFADELKSNSVRAKELTNKKTLSKSDQQELFFMIEKMSQEVSSNIPFYARCFQESMDEVVQEAKMEVENSIQHKINVLGLEKLHEQQNLIR